MLCSNGRKASTGGRGMRNQGMRIAVLSRVRSLEVRDDEEREEDVGIMV